MALNTYIGARYVPLIKGEWDSTISYEPLTVVLYQGNSYTSICTVPIGINPTNNSYWALTGNYNAQIEQYRLETKLVGEKVNAVTETVNTIRTNTRNVIIISNSYGVTPSESNNFISIFKVHNPNMRVYNYSYQGSDFDGYTNAPNFTNTLKNNISVDDPSTITDIIALGGYNDGSRYADGAHTTTDVYRGITSFITECAKYPNAKVHVVYCIGNKLNTNIYKQFRPIFNVYKLASGQKGNNKNLVDFYDFTTVLHSTELLDESGNHPTAGGASVIAYGLDAIVNGSSPVISEIPNLVPVFTASGICSTLEVNSPSCSYNDKTGVFNTYNCTFNVTGAVKAGVDYTLATVDKTCYFGNLNAGVCITTVLINNTTPISAMFFFENLSLKIRILDAFEKDLGSVTSIVTYGIKIIFDATLG